MYTFSWTPVIFIFEVRFKRNPKAVKASVPIRFADALTLLLSENEYHIVKPSPADNAVSAFFAQTLQHSG